MCKLFYLEMNQFLTLLDSKYSKVEFAKNYNFFDTIKNGVYLWYYPIKLSYINRNINSTLDFFYEKELKNYNIANEIFIEDRGRHMKSLLTGIECENPKKTITRTNNFNEERVSEVLSELFMAFSLYNRPIYIGKSNPRSEESGRTLSNRIKEHLKNSSNFGNSITNLELEINIKDFIVKVIDVGKIELDYFKGEFKDKDIDLANFLEIHLINIFKPNFNINYK
jgi:hypothetical protein